MGTNYRFKRGQKNIQAEADEALLQGRDTFRSQYPCPGFHLAERCCHTLECLECKRLRRLARKVQKIKAADARNDKPDGVMRRTLKMKRHGLHAAACKVPRKETQEDRKRRTENANQSRDRTRRQQERSRREMAFADDWDDPFIKPVVVVVPTWGTAYPALMKTKTDKE